MKVCAISFVECWKNDAGQWHAAGGFPIQMTAIASLFDSMDLLVVQGKPKAGGNPLPAEARIVPMRRPAGEDGRRKLSVVTNLPYYAGIMLKHIRQADAVHVPLPGDLPLLGMILAVVSRRRLLARYGGSWYANTQTTLMNRVTRNLMRRFAGGSNIMLATGGGKSAPAPGIEWIFSTVLTESELRRIRPDLDRGLQSPPELVYCGRLSPEKGVAVLLEAMGQLKLRGVSLRLTLMGDGLERAALQALAARLNLADTVRFAGLQDRAGLTTHFLNADLCVQPSLSEGFSKAWLDAMAHGVPVLASRVGAAAEVIGEGEEHGWLIAPGDARLLADTIQEIVTQPRNWPALRRRCRAYAESLTVENWKQTIGTICSRSWNCVFEGGRLTI